LQDCVGSVEPGKQADLIAVDFDQPETQPVYNPISQLVYAAHGSQVTHSWIGGIAVMRERELTRMALPGVLERAARWGGVIEATRAES